MLEHRGIAYRRIDLPRGAHPFLVRRVLRFAGGTVPALRVDGARLQQTRTISRALGLVTPESMEVEEWAEHAMSELKRDVWLWALSRRIRRGSPPSSLGLIPAVIDRVDELLARCVIGNGEPGSADIHAAVLVRLIWCVREQREGLAARPALAFANRLCPPARYPGRLSVLL